MISVLDYKMLCRVIIDAVQIPDLDEIVTVVHEDHLKRKLQNRRGTVLALIYPSNDSWGVEDNTGNTDTALIYILQYFDKIDTDEDVELEKYLLLQKYIARFREELIEGAKTTIVLRNLDMESIHIEPEWNVAGGYMGYSMTFSF